MARSSPIEAGITIGAYTLVRKLGQGGMGSVWEASHSKLGTPAAIKIIEGDLAASSEALTRFKREAQSAASIRSTHVVQILDYGEDDGMPFIVMEKMVGEDLGCHLRRMGRLPPDRTAEILTQAARALRLAHSVGFVHRDLKPDNLFLARDLDGEVVKVLDFGIAKAAGGGIDMTVAQATATGAMLGTPYYMSPEQATGRKEVDHRTDVWALGVIAYECLTGKRPFDGQTIGALVLSICSEEPPVPSMRESVPLGFDAWFARSTARDAEQRFQNVQDQLDALRELCGLTPAFSRGPEGLQSSASFAADGVTSESAETPPAVSHADAALPALVAQTMSNSVRTLADAPRQETPAWLVVGALASLTVVGTTVWWFNLAALDLEEQKPESASPAIALEDEQPEPPRNKEPSKKRHATTATGPWDAQDSRKQPEPSEKDVLSPRSSSPRETVGPNPSPRDPSPLTTTQPLPAPKPAKLAGPGQNSQSEPAPSPVAPAVPEDDYGF